MTATTSIAPPTPSTQPLTTATDLRPALLQLNRALQQHQLDPEIDAQTSREFNEKVTTGTIAATASASSSSSSHSDSQPTTRRHKSKHTVHDYMPPVALPSLIDAGLKVPNMLHTGWQEWKSRQAPDSIKKINMHFYSIDIPGIRSERQLVLLTMTQLPDRKHLPPIFVHPHGIVQREVKIAYQGITQLTRGEIEKCEAFHIQVFHTILTRTNPTTSASYPMKWSDQSLRNYMIVPCVPHQREFNDDSLHFNEHDESVVLKRHTTIQEKAPSTNPVPFDVGSKLKDVFIWSESEMSQAFLDYLTAWEPCDKPGKWIDSLEFPPDRKSFGCFICHCKSYHRWKSASVRRDQTRNCSKCDQPKLPTCMWLTHEMTKTFSPLPRHSQAADDEVRSILIDQAALRASLCEGQPQEFVPSKSTESNELDIDFEYIETFVCGSMHSMYDDVERMLIRIFSQHLPPDGTPLSISNLHRMVINPYIAKCHLDSIDKLLPWLLSHPQHFFIDNTGNEMTIARGPLFLTQCMLRSVPDLTYSGDSLIDRPDRSHTSFIIETRYNHRLHINTGEPTELTTMSPFPNRAYANYFEYYKQKWPNVPIRNEKSTLIQATAFNPTPLNVLRPESASVKHHTNLLLVADTVFVWTHCTPEFMHLLRMMPDVLHQFEMNLLQYEFAQKLHVPLNPSALAQSVTASNAQQSFMLQPTRPPGSLSDLGRKWQSVPTSMVHSYDRLKFIGDPIMKLLACKILMCAYPSDAESTITQKKGLMLNTDRLAQAAIRVGLQHVAITQPFHNFVPPGFASATSSPTSASPFSPSSPSSSPAVVTKVSKHVLADMISSLIGAAWFSTGGECTCLAMMISLGIIDEELIATVLRGAPQRVPSQQRHEQVLEMMHTSLIRSILPLESMNSPSSALRQNLTAQPWVESMLDYTFRHPTLFLRAFIHSSWDVRDTYRQVRGLTHVPLPNFERLELLGDAILEVCVSTFIYHTPPWCYIVSSGDLTFARQKLVNNELFIRVMIDQRLHQLILHTSEQLKHSITTYIARIHSTRKDSEFSHTLSSSSSSSPSPPKLLADVFESLLGAIYIDSGFSSHRVWSSFSRLLHFEVDWMQVRIRTFGGRALTGEVQPLPTWKE